MSIYLTGVTFKDAKIRAIDDAAVFASVVSDGIARGCELTYSGATLNLGAGNIIACGRNIKVPAAQAIAVTGASSGYARLVLTIDLSASEGQQIKLDMEYAASESGFSSLTQEDINDGGTVYQTEIVRVKLGSSGITGRTFFADAHARGWANQYTLRRDYWQSVGTNLYRASFGVIGRISPDVSVIASCDPSDMEEYCRCQVRLVEQRYGYVVYEATSLPTKSLKVNLLLI